MAEFVRGDRPLVVVTLQWMQDGMTVQRTYGPWVVAEDDSHMAEITQFMRRKTAEGRQPDVAIMSIVADPVAEA